MRPALHHHHHPTQQLLPPTSSLPPLRSLDRVAEGRVFQALDNLHSLYCVPPQQHEFSTSVDLQSCLRKKSKKAASPIAGTGTGTSTPVLVDSGYISEIEEIDENEDDGEYDDNDDDDGPDSLRADPFERNFAERWLTGFLARAEEDGEEDEPMLFSSAEGRDRAVELASSVLSSFFASTAEEEEKHAEESAQIAREFCFRLSVPTDATATETAEIKVHLNDGLAGTKSDDHTDVGLQSWAGAIVFSELMCASPAKFGLTATTMTSTEDKPGQKSGLHIIELGAGTGLVSFVLAKALSLLQGRGATVVATDYHPAVMENLRANVTMNFPCSTTKTTDSHGGRTGAKVAVEARQLDWADPSALNGPPLEPGSADVLVATDVVYAPEHAAWLRGCASRLLKRDGQGGVFWLVATVRPTGKFEGICDTVRAVFGSLEKPLAAMDNRGDYGNDGRVLTILDEEWIEKRPGVGRGDESGYRLFRIGWV